MKLDKKNVQKWKSYVESNLTIKNKYFMYLCCHYLEFLSNKYPKDILIDDFLDLQNRIEKLDCRLKIVGEYINELTGNKEYKLEDGRFIDIENFSTHMSIKNLIKVFGYDFLKSIDHDGIRDYRIDEILDESK